MSDPSTGVRAGTPLPDARVAGHVLPARLLVYALLPYFCIGSLAFMAPALVKASSFFMAVSLCIGASLATLPSFLAVSAHVFSALMDAASLIDASFYVMAM